MITWSQFSYLAAMMGNSQGARLPPSLVLGEGNVKASMEGSALAPDVSTQWEAPRAEASGTATFTRDATHFACRAPALDVSGVLHMRPPPFEMVKAVTSQREATALAAPVRPTPSMIVLCSDVFIEVQLSV